MDEQKKKILQCIRKQNEKQYVHKKQIKAKKKKMRKARNHLLSMENSKSEPINDKRNDLSEWESSFWRTNLIEAQERIEKLTIENLRLKDILKSKDQDLERIKDESRGYKGSHKKESVISNLHTCKIA